MARYTQAFATTKTPADLGSAVAAYLQSQGFQPIAADQQTWKKGGLFSNPLFIHVETRPGEMRLEAWVRFTLLPNVFVGEFDLEGFFLVVQKRELKRHLEKIQQLA